jgi:hypothetical protein
MLALPGGGGGDGVVARRRLRGDIRGDPFDPARLRLDPATLGRPARLEEVRAVVPRKIQKQQQQHFVRVPWVWVERLTKARSIATYRVALHILYWHWKGGGMPFTLANTAMAAEGVSRWGKWDGLQELERLGLITVERRRRRSPQVTVLVKS